MPNFSSEYDSFSLLFSSVSFCIFSDSVSSGNGVEIGSDLGSLIGLGVGDGSDIQGGSGSC
ncbi:MAG: hypothetical protein ACREAK_00485 [Nitrosarchaeum sp.]